MSWRVFCQGAFPKVLYFHLKNNLLAMLTFEHLCFWGGVTRKVYLRTDLSDFCLCLQKSFYYYKHNQSHICINMAVEWPAAVAIFPFLSDLGLVSVRLRHRNYCRFLQQTRMSCLRCLLGKSCWKPSESEEKFFLILWNKNNHQEQEIGFWEVLS